MKDGSGIKSGWVALSGFVGAALFVAALLWLNSYFQVARHRIIYERVLSLDNSALRDLRAREAETLNSYGWIDQENGVARIPVERAMEIMTQEARESRRGDGQG